MIKASNLVYENIKPWENSHNKILSLHVDY
nr:MAG TPA: hypothetical protein [Caudoviricetes sp.]